MLAEKESRLQYSEICTSVVEWLNTAETVLEEDCGGVDYEVVTQKLALHKVCFGLHLEVTSFFVLFIGRSLSESGSVLILRHCL